MTPSRVVCAALTLLLGAAYATASTPQEPAPQPPAVDRTAADKVTIHAVRLEEPGELA